MLRGLHVVLLLWLGAAPGRSEHYRFHRFGPEDGLGASVTHVLQDGAGYLWVGTATGLFRYDGGAFRSFGMQAGLPANAIRGMSESPDGVLWVLTSDGLTRLHGDTFEVIDTGAPARELRTVSIAPNGQIYVGAQRGLFRATPAARLVRPEFLPVAGVPRGEIGAILAEGDAKTWFACGAGLCLLDKSDVRVFDAAAGLPDGPWNALLRDRSGTLWARSAEHLYVLAPGSGRFTPRDRDLPNSTSGAVALIEDREGRIWTSTDRGVARWTASGWRTVSSSNGLPADAVTALWGDRQGSLWIGLAGIGMVRWAQPFQWTNWTTGDGLPDATVTAVLREGPAHLWVGTAKGLVRFGPGTDVHTWNRRSGLPGDRVTALALAPDGAVWVACSPGGVGRVDRSGKRDLEDAHVNALAFDVSHRLWVAADEGVFRSTAPGETFRFEEIKLPGSAGHRGYAALAADRRGGMWIAAATGLLHWEDGSWIWMGVAEGLRDAGLSSVLSLPDGSVWVAYREPFGLAHLVFASDGWHATAFTQADGLPSDEIRFLGRDASGQLWAGTDRGVVSGSPGSWRRWSQEDGLLSPDSGVHSFLAGGEGTVWLGTKAGLARFMPAHRTMEEDPPPPAIASARFGDRHFDASFAALNLSGRTDVNVRYQLWGRDTKWIEATGPAVRYSDLPEGTYRFEVQTRYGKGAWSTKSESVNFRILPIWWATWWFFVIIAVSAAAMFYGALLWALDRLRRENRRLMRARDRSAAESESADVYPTMKGDENPFDAACCERGVGTILDTAGQ